MNKFLWAALAAGLALAAGCSQPLEGIGAGRDLDRLPSTGITSFSLAGIRGEIVGTTIYVRDVPLYTAEHTVTDLKNAVPVIGYTGGTLDPDPGTPRNFAAPVSYSLVTEDGVRLNYTVVVTARPLISVAEIETYLPLAAAVYDGTLEDPIPLPISLVLSTANWQGILSVIQGGGRYAALDLSACTAGTDIAGGGLYGDHTFDPGASNTGEHRIVSLVLPDAAEKIKPGADVSTAAFRHFIVLKSIAGAGVTEVGDYAFGDCTALSSVSLPAAAAIGDYAFAACTILTTISLPAAITIGDEAFYDCTSLISVSFPAARTIGGFAFYACVSLETISLPSATSIGSHAFDGCTALSSVNFPLARTIASYAFYECDALNSVSLPAVRTINIYAFYGCDSLREVNFPAARTIDDYVFQNCVALNSVNLPVVTTIGDRTFGHCNALTTVNLPMAISIGTQSFWDCTALREINIPMMTSIGLAAFHSIGQNQLTVTLGGSPPTLLTVLFNGVTSTKNVTVRVPYGATGYASPSTDNDTSTVCWGNGFRGGGWDGSGFVSGGSVNTNITLTITTY
jgi:hypothetical protein